MIKRFVYKSNRENELKHQVTDRDITGEVWFEVDKLKL